MPIGGFFFSILFSCFVSQGTAYFSWISKINIQELFIYYQKIAIEK